MLELLLIILLIACIFGALSIHDVLWVVVIVLAIVLITGRT